MDQAPVYEELKGTELEVLCDVKEQPTDPIDTRSLVEIARDKRESATKQSKILAKEALIVLKQALDDYCDTLESNDDNKEQKKILLVLKDNPMTEGVKTFMRYNDFEMSLEPAVKCDFISALNMVRDSPSELKRTINNPK